MLHNRLDHFSGIQAETILRRSSVIMSHSSRRDHTLTQVRQSSLLLDYDDDVLQLMNKF